ncbi:MAG: 3'-5' exonuclease [Ilumatobacteraceae bacterium]
MLLGGAHEGKVSAGELRELEAASVAEAIDAILADPDAWPVRDPDAERAAGGGRGVQRWRRPTLGDITILVPTRTSLTFLRTALESHHIPYRLATGTLVYDTQEIRDLVSTLKAIDDPSDTISLVAALRSPLFACSDVDLFTWTHAGGVWDLRSDAPDALPPDHPVASAIGALRQLWRDRWWLTPAQLLDRVMSERRAMVLAFGDPRHREVWRRLRFFSDQARTFEESGGVGLRAFLAWVELQGEDRARVHEPLLPETDDDAVQIMTVHGSKGLEFPITILSGLTTAPNSGQRGLSILWEEDRPPSVRLRRNLQTGNHDLRADLEAEMDGYEKDRLLYVALTRPGPPPRVDPPRRDRQAGLGHLRGEGRPTLRAQAGAVPAGRFEPSSEGEPLPTESSAAAAPPSTSNSPNSPNSSFRPPYPRPGRTSAIDGSPTAPRCSPR